MVQLKRLAVLYSELSGYIMACFDKLRSEHDVELLVFRWPIVDEAPFDEGQYTSIDSLYSKASYTVDQINSVIDEFNPQAIIMSGWMDRDYMRVARRF